MLLTTELCFLHEGFWGFNSCPCAWELSQLCSDFLALFLVVLELPLYVKFNLLLRYSFLNFWESHTLFWSCSHPTPSRDVSSLSTPLSSVSSYFISFISKSFFYIMRFDNKSVVIMWLSLCLSGVRVASGERESKLSSVSYRGNSNPVRTELSPHDPMHPYLASKGCLHLISEYQHRLGLQRMFWGDTNTVSIFS